MHRSLLALVAATTLAAPAVVAAPPAARAYTFRVWDPGHLPGDDWGRRTFALRVQGDTARLAITTERPPQAQRGRANATGFKRHGDETVLTGTVQRDAAGLTIQLSGDVVLTCVETTVAVHAARATVAAGCSHCYDACGDKPTAIWKPATTRRQKALACKPTGELPGLNPDIEELVFGTRAGIEHLVGPTDCPPRGLRAPSS